MILHLRYLFAFLLLFLLPLLGLAQTSPDTVIQGALPPVPTDTVVARDFGVNALRFGVDIKPWIHGIASRERNFYNAHIRFDLGPRNMVRYGISLDLTHSTANLRGDSTTYFNNGKAASVGFYLNVIPDDQDHNLVTIGLGYGRSWFDESLSGYVQDNDYGFFLIERESTALRAGWVELNGGMQARVWKQLYVGYNLQLRILPHFNRREQVQIYEIPGFGKASQKSAFGFSYYMLYRIPFRNN